MPARGRDGAWSDWRERCCDRRRLRGLAALSYGVVVRWPPAVAHSGTGSVALSLHTLRSRAPNTTRGRRDGRRLLRTAVLGSLDLNALRQNIIQKTDHPTEASGETGPRLTNSLRFSRAREKRGTCRTGRRNPFC